jgi:hypothetical protein
LTQVREPICYQPTVDDYDRRLKLLITPVRSDGENGPTYQHIMERLTLPVRTQVIENAHPFASETKQSKT